MIYGCYFKIQTDKYVSGMNQTGESILLEGNGVSVYDKEVLYTLNTSTPILPSGEILSHLFTGTSVIQPLVSLNFRVLLFISRDGNTIAIGDPSYTVEARVNF
jgi:hypothetical protein